MEKYLTPKEAAERLGVSRTTIHKWVREGHLHGVQRDEGRAIVIPESSLKGIYRTRNRNGKDPAW